MVRRAEFRFFVTCDIIASSVCRVVVMRYFSLQPFDLLGYFSRYDPNYRSARLVSVAIQPPTDRITALQRYSLHVTRYTIYRLALFLGVAVYATRHVPNP